MSDFPRQILIPLVNPNEPEALIASLVVSEGQQVSEGDLLCTLETTKAAAEVSAEIAGYVVGLRFSVGQTAQAGEVLCYLAEHPDQELPTTPETQAQVQSEQQLSTANQDLPAGLRITQPALQLARQANLDLESLPRGPLITGAFIRARTKTIAQSLPLASEFEDNALIIYGGGGHCKSLIDLVRASNQYEVIGLIDDGLAPGTTVMGVPILGGSESLAGLFARGVRLAANAVGGIGNIKTRVDVFERLRAAGFELPVLLHPRAFVEANAQLSEGVQIFPHAYVGSEARLGSGVIVNTSAVVSHDCQVGDYANISPGALLAGNVHVGERVLVGMGLTIHLGVVIGAGARLGNGSTIKSDVPEGGIVRAGTIWPVKESQD